MKKTKILFLTIILLLNGCSYRELNNLAIGNALGIDYIDNEYVVTVQVLDLKKEGESNENETSKIYEGTGKTIPTAIRNISLKYPKELYLGHLEVVILGQTTTNKNIQELFDYFIRSPETRNDFDVLVAPENDAKEILKPSKKESLDAEEDESFPTDEIISTIENSMNHQGTSVKINMEELISAYLEQGIDPVVTTIKNDVDEKYILSGIMAFNNHTNKVFLSDEEAIAYNMINSNFSDIIVNTEYKDTTLDLIIVKPKTSIDMKVSEDKIDITINIATTSQVADIKKEVNFENEQVQKEVENKINTVLEDYINSLIKTSKENNIDIIGLKNALYKKHNKYYEQYKDVNIYEVADIKVNVNVKVFRYGNIYRSTKGE